MAKRGLESRDWFWLTSDWLSESVVNFLIQSESEVKQSQSKHNITFDTHLKTALYTIHNSYTLYYQLILSMAWLRVAQVVVHLQWYRKGYLFESC